jgi:hypothetical protein
MLFSLWRRGAYGMASTQVLEIKVLTCGGMFDLMSELEAAFLVNSLGLFRNVVGPGRATPRANINLIRAYTTKDFYRGLSGDEHVLHLITHASAHALQTGNGKSDVTAAGFQEKAEAGNLTVPEIVVSTGCSFQSAAWRSALKAAGGKILIAAQQSVTPANLTAFDMSFYSALLSQVRRGKSNLERAKESFVLADAHYRAIHAVGATFAKFTLEEL